ncbi:MAG: rhamnulokinase [Candidatus Aminicenantes bacterium]|nr:rhamnulokinase [Candidatus Aminicenantes bacterium]
MSDRHFLAFDIGAESGRAIVGTISGGRIGLREIHRFPNAPIALFGRLHWDIYALLEEMKKGLAACASEVPSIESIAVDTWGVDFGLLAADGSLLGLPFAYRDPRNIPAMQAFLAKMPADRLYERTGIQLLPFNSLFQLQALASHNAPLLKAADRLLFMPDLLTWFISGVAINEATIASTSQMIDPRTRDWAGDLLAFLGLPPSLVRRPIEPGNLVGSLLPGLARETGLRAVPVSATASHDTASAVAAVPAEGRRWAYISSGTWSLVGIETPAPLITERTRALNFTNEGGVAGTVRFLKNVAGLWLVQRCRRLWDAQSPIGYDDLKRLAEDAPAFRAFVDPDAPEFLNPDDMPEAIRGYCRRTGQAPPDGQGPIIRCVLESLALKYRAVLDDLASVSPEPIDKVHIIGGGSQNWVLNRFTADATGRTVVAGPIEATALGNILGQALALGCVGSLEEARSLAAASFRLETYEPRPSAGWDKAYDRFRGIVESGRKGEAS